MPSLSSLIRSSRSNRSSQEHNGNSTGKTEMEDGIEEKMKRRQSKRDFFRNLITRDPSNRSSSQFGERSSNAYPNRPLESPSLILDPNKPLPPAPISEDDDGTKQQKPVSRPIITLERIISPISFAELQKLFSGAPQFFAQSDQRGGVPHPSVAFPWDVETLARELKDYTPILDSAWSTVTAWPHVTRDIQHNPEAVEQYNKKIKAQYIPGCRERPNMISMQGLERGTIGFAAALDLGIADAIKEQTEVYHPADSDALLELRKEYLKERNAPKMGSALILKNSLVDVSKAYYEDVERSIMELYSSLFLKLHPPNRISDHNDPYSLKVQINEIVKILATSGVWVDFSLVEYRIRLGQILWTAQPSPEGTNIINQDSNHNLPEKHWLLFQILLSCELLLRLDIITSRSDKRTEAGIIADNGLSEKLSSDSIRWSLLLARYWLENIKVDETQPEVPDVKTTWAGAFSRITNIASPTDPNDILDPADINIEDIHFEGINKKRQLTGLMRFGSELKWPNIEENINTNGISMSSFSTPAQTPMSNQRSSSYFGQRPELSRSRMSASLSPEGWLSNTYLSGLILPGEGLSHFLISTLLENDQAAMARLGRDACLYGGFKYSKRSFWSKDCIVGRVLAAGKGATECMGWISSPVTPKGSKNAGDAWIDIEVDPQKKDGNPRIRHSQAIERDGHVIGGADSSSVLPGDFVLPSEEPTISEALSVNFESLDLFVTDDSISISGTPSSAADVPIITYAAMMRFSIDVDGEDKRELNLELKHHINFITAYPCVTSPEALKLTNLGNAHNGPNSPIGSPRDFTGHPLHKAFTYTKIPLSSVLFSQQQAFESLLSPPTSPTVAAHSSTHTTNSNIPRILVIDCIDSTTVAFPIRPSPSPRASGNRQEMFGSDLEILARAVCAERGWDAIISRRGRGCLACSIREAAALGWRVIIRLG